MHASDAEIQHKQRQRDILRQQLDEQRREKQAKRDAEKARQQAAEEREERKRVEAGLDIWEGQCRRQNSRGNGRRMRRK